MNLRTLNESNLPKFYGTTRPAQIAARLCTLQNRFAPIMAPIAAPALEIEAAFECQDYRARMTAHQIERTGLRIERAELRQYPHSADLCAELARIEARLCDLDDFLIFEPDFDFDSTPYPQECDQYDEFDADLPDELDGSFAWGAAQCV